MKKTNIILFTCAAMLVNVFIAGAQEGYSDYRILSGKIQALAKENPGLCTVRSLATTTGGNNIWLLTVGTGDTENKPGIAIVGGTEGNYILGREIAFGIANSLVRNASVPATRQLLEKVTFYILPDVSPDASAQNFLLPKYERNLNAAQTDDDRDFLADEDPFEDLDGNGLITIVRIEDPSGKFIMCPDDERVMAEADLSKGQTGKYIVISEGVDNDKDGKFNEDGPGGVNFNRNFTFNYEEFGPGSGMHPVSEPETKAVADFLYDRFNVFAVFAFGPQDNLGQPMKASDQPRTDRRFTTILRSDEAINKLVSDIYHRTTGLKGAPQAKAVPGNFMEWAYFHYGRYSFGTPGWWYPAEKGKNPEAEFLKYAGSSDVFIPWKEIRHPDFPDKKAEAGGIKPFALMNPPADSIAGIVEKHYRFISEVAALHPGLVFTDVKTEQAGSGLYRVSLKVINKGVFATMAEAGEMNSFTRLMRISLETGKNQEVISGRKVQRMGRLAGGESAEYSWLVSGNGPVRIIAGSVNTGIVSTTLDLK